MASENPVSPKIVFGGLGAALVPTVLWVLAILAENLHLIEGLPAVVYQIAAVVGAIVGAYFKTDGLRITTLDPVAVAKLENPEQALHQAAQQLPSVQDTL